MDSVETLRDWIVQEAEFQTTAVETIKGITTNQKKKKHSDGSFFSDQKTSKFRQCKSWKTWSAAKKDKLCLCCLGDDNYSKGCKRIQYGTCGIQYCDKEHHKLLQFQKKDDSTKGCRDGASGQDGPRSNQIKQGDGSGDQTLSTVSNDSQVALRTIPVMLSNGKNKLVENTLLHDGSDKSYVNSDVADLEEYNLGFSKVNW